MSVILVILIIIQHRLGTDDGRAWINTHKVAMEQSVYKAAERLIKLSVNISSSIEHQYAEAVQVVIVNVGRRRNENTNHAQTAIKVLRIMYQLQHVFLLDRLQALKCICNVATHKHAKYAYIKSLMNNQAF